MFFIFVLFVLIVEGKRKESMYFRGNSAKILSFTVASFSGFED